MSHWTHTVRCVCHNRYDSRLSNVKIVQCTIFHWNPWTSNWINISVFEARGVANFGTRYILGTSRMHHKLYEMKPQQQKIWERLLETEKRNLRCTLNWPTGGLVRIPFRQTVLSFLPTYFQPVNFPQPTIISIYFRQSPLHYSVHFVENAYTWFWLPFK